jgi:hypothetical protein
MIVVSIEVGHSHLSTQSRVGSQILRQSRQQSLYLSNFQASRNMGN